MIPAVGVAPTNMFPSPCGERVLSNSIWREVDLKLVSAEVSVPLRGKGSVEPASIEDGSAIAGALFPSPCGERVLSNRRQDLSPLGMHDRVSVPLRGKGSVEPIAAANLSCCGTSCFRPLAGKGFCRTKRRSSASVPGTCFRPLAGKGFCRTPRRYLCL